MTSTLRDRTILITGASRGIGRAMALRFAREGARLVLAGKTLEPHPKLPGTLPEVAEEIRQLGSEALVVRCDVRHEGELDQLVEKSVQHFGGLDIVINNAGAIHLAPVEKTPLKKFDLMHQINTRAVLALAQRALPVLKQSDHAHILSLSPPLNLAPKWFAAYTPYTLTKYGMSMLTLGMAAEFRKYGIAVNSLWPRTLIATAAVEHQPGGTELIKRARKPEIMADAACEILKADPATRTGQHCIDEDILKEAGITDLEAYKAAPNAGSLLPDLYVD
ncbi:MAG: NAD(P)-dependent oxidoreductase [Gammaproteobacteria bacterium]|nr:MAG: NAD(P)-dependent oxidoreductase [Gammaproteobacteria bacterium]